MIAGIGSSPRVRGTAVCRCDHRYSQRFIPARAGNSTFAGCSSMRAPVHPRACGEQSVAFAFAALMVGSSPRVRGTGHRHSDRPAVARFIPARAGNSPSRPRPPPRRPVHPRACGEQRFGVNQQHPGFGSSPRVRGTGRPRHACACPRRFIPARAGNRHGSWTGPFPAPVHPRACGEQAAAGAAGVGNAGSSPRVRGTGS